MEVYEGFVLKDRTSGSCQLLILVAKYSLTTGSGFSQQCEFVCKPLDPCLSNGQAKKTLV